MREVIKVKSVLIPQDVPLFFRALIDEGLNAHPDEDFFNYVNVWTGLPTYTMEEAVLRNCLMASAFEVCAKYNMDIYEWMEAVYSEFWG